MGKNGITLIALVITIIVLLILAGITINLTIGENGLIAKALESGDRYKLSQIREQVEQGILELDMEKVTKGEVLTVEEAIIGLQHMQTFEEIDLLEETGICDIYIVKLGYDENGKVKIIDIQKDNEARIKITTNPKGYTNTNIEVEIGISGSQNKISKIEVEGMTQKEEGKYEITKNGTYPIKVTLDNGETLEKELVIESIDKVAPKEFTANVTLVGEEIQIEVEAEDGEETQESIKSGIERYEYYINNEKYETQPIKGLTESTYRVYVIAYDKAGNSTKSEEVVVKKSIKIKEIAAGEYHSLAIDTQGNLWGFGSNRYGEMGNGTTSYEKILAQVIKGGTKFSEIAAGYTHNLAIDVEGNLWAWGRNIYGQLGNSSTTDSSIPVQIKEGTKFSKIAAGWSHSLAIDIEGNLWGWGYNGNGELGDGTRNNSSIPVQIKEGTKFSQITAGNGHTLAIDIEGNLWTWGKNGNGQLGNGYATILCTQIKGGTKFSQIAANEYHSLAIDIEGNLWAWGKNDYGQLGDGTTTEASIPIKIKEGTKFSMVGTGRYHSIAIDTQGNLWSWGTSIHGQLGNGTTGMTASSYIPTEIVNIETSFNMIRTGVFHNIAIDTQGNLWGWGVNNVGQLSLSNNLQTTPMQIFF